MSELSDLVARRKRTRRALHVPMNNYVMDILSMAAETDHRDARSQASHVLAGWADRWAKQHQNEMQAWADRELRLEQEWEDRERELSAQMGKA